MPFASAAQSRKCFSQAGPDGKTPGGWDCREFASVTDYKKLPERKKKPAAKAAADLLAAARRVGL